MASTETSGVLVYVGTYTTRETFVHGKAEGIVALRLDPVSGAFRHAAVTPGGDNPSYLALHPSGRYLYAVNERYTGEGGGVSAFAVDRQSGSLTLLNQQASHG